MITWRDEGPLLTVRRHGETAAIIEVFTATHGKTAGVVRGASSRKMAPALQVGTELDVTWKARLAEHLGSYTVEPIRTRAALAMSDRVALAGLNAVTAILSFVLPEGESMPKLQRRSTQLLDLLEAPEVWPLAYLQWELALLETLGFGLDLKTCAVTGEKEPLVYVSPKSGRAVTAVGAGGHASKLLPLPPVLKGEGDASIGEVLTALGVTGHFLTHHVAPSLGNKPIPEARARLLEALGRQM